MGRHSGIRVHLRRIDNVCGLVKRWTPHLDVHLDAAQAKWQERMNPPEDATFFTSYVRIGGALGKLVWLNHTQVAVRLLDEPNYSQYGNSAPFQYAGSLVLSYRGGWKSDLRPGAALAGRKSRWPATEGRADFVVT